MLNYFFDEMSKTAMSYSMPLMKSFFSLKNFAKQHAPVGTAPRLKMLRSNMKKAMFDNDTKLMNSTHSELSNMAKNIAKQKGITAPTAYSPISSIPKPSISATSNVKPVTSFGTGAHRTPRPSLVLGSWR